MPDTATLSHSPGTDELLKLIDKTVYTSHERVNPCFMTGKGCVYADQIDEALKSRTAGLDSDRHKEAGCGCFVITPFRPHLKVFFQNCLVPFLEENYGFIFPQASDGERAIPIRAFTLARADEVARPGIIICEGVCKRIQESDFVIADISIPNDNVFYELGLAYGIGHKIVVIHQRASSFGIAWAKELGCRAYPYEDLGLIKASDFPVSSHIWRDASRDSDQFSGDPKISLFEMMSEGYNPDLPANDDIRLSFSQHVLSDVGVAMDRICKGLTPGPGQAPRAIDGYRESIIAKYLKVAEKVDPTKSFAEVKTKIDSAYCLIVRTGRDCHPMAYFWLGYAHARGKNVIPITALDLKSAKSREALVTDLAFDIRAQRHMIFNPNEPDVLERQLEQTLRVMIRADFSEWSRKHFWEHILGSRGEVSILTGALHSKEHKREMIGDWDLRAASELTSYFSRHQYHPKIETPIYQWEFARKFEEMNPEEYVRRVVQGMNLSQKNCVIIASPDVNPLTEIVLGRLYGFGDESLFSAVPTKPPNGYPPKAVVVWKERRASGSGKAAAEASLSASRVFYYEDEGGDQERRGLASRGFQRDEKPLLPYVSQEHQEHSEGSQQRFDLYAHLVIAKNPFPPRDSQRYVIVLNGVSGPATFALTHVLTGGGNEEFVSYDEGFDPAAKCEDILSRLLVPVRSATFRGLQCVVRVWVGHAGTRAGSTTPHRTLARTGATFDWRRILKWELDVTVWDEAYESL